MVKNMPAKQEMKVGSLGLESPLEKETLTHSSILAWKIPWTEEPGGLQSTGLQRVGHDLATKQQHQCFHCHNFVLLLFMTARKESSQLSYYSEFLIIQIQGRTVSLFKICYKSTLYTGCNLSTSIHKSCKSFLGSGCSHPIMTTPIGLASAPCLLRGTWLSWCYTNSSQHSCPQPNDLLGNTLGASEPIQSEVYKGKHTGDGPQ